MFNSFAWTVSHLSEIAIAITCIIGFFSIIAKLTPTPKDDLIVSKVHVFWTKVVDLLALNKQRGSNKLVLLLAVFFFACTSALAADPAPQIEKGWGPSAVGTFGAFYANGDYKLMQSGVAFGTAYTFGSNQNVSSVGLYLGPQASQVEGQTDASIVTLVYADLYKTSAGRFGLGIGTQLWKGGSGFRGVCRQDTTFMAIGYKF